ncbi:MAG: hypothetical protein AB1782_06270 [Cyanobacteriota bacterium]
MLGSHVLLIEKTIVFHTVFKAISIAGLGAIVSGIIGYYIGKVIEAPPSTTKILEKALDETDSDLLINDLMLNDLKNMDLPND